MTDLAEEAERKVFVVDDDDAVRDSLEALLMSDIPAFPYSILWEERVVKSVANLTRTDGEEFLRIAPTVPVRTTVKLYRLEDANEALDDLRHGRFEGAAVLTM